MLQSEKLDKLAAALVKAQATMPPIAKDREGQIGKRKYKYAGLDSILDTIRPHLAEHGLAVSQFLSDNQLVTMLVHESGQYFGGGLDVLEVSDPQVFGNWMTYLRRYGYNGIVGILPGDDDDGAQASTHAKHERTGPKYDEAKPDPKIRPDQVDVIDKLVKLWGPTNEEEAGMIQAMSDRYGTTSMLELTQGQANWLIGVLEKKLKQGAGA